MKSPTPSRRSGFSNSCRSERRDIETVVKLISSTTTKRGLKVDCVVDQNTYERGVAVSDEAFAAIDLEPIAPFGQWNYIIRGFKSESE